MHELSSSFVLGYHGCDQEVAEQLLNNIPFLPSHNDYDWLGSGIYFWEANPQRGLEFANELADRSPEFIKNPTVVGAVLDLGYCLDLTTSSGLRAKFPLLCPSGENKQRRNTVVLRFAQDDESFVGIAIWILL
jgi:hypothetical protein